MAAPKKKVSRGRRDRRRYGGKKAPTQPMTTQCKVSGDVIRAHSISKSAIYELRDK